MLGRVMENRSMKSAIGTTSSSVVARGLMTSPVVQAGGLFLLCSAYIQGPLVKIFDFSSAIAEMGHFGLPTAPIFSVALIAFELVMSALVITGVNRWLGALALAAFTFTATFLALRFWELPLGPDRTMAMNGYFEHLGLVGAFLLVASHDFTRSRNHQQRI
jgi:uncharacterized membrane protein YphA (DoxX/SURF4 family)